MPLFREKLRPEEISGLAAYVASLRDVPAAEAEGAASPPSKAP